MTNAAQGKWDAIYTKKQDPPRKPDFFPQVLPYLNSGSVLDIGCGDGACALPLAKLGYEVTGLDVSTIGINSLIKNGLDLGLSISGIVADLETNYSVNTLDEKLEGTKFDNILIARYKPSLNLWRDLHRMLKEDGRIILLTFNLLHHEKTGFSRRFCLQPNEFLDLNQHIRILEYKALSGDGYDMDLYVFDKSR